MFWNEFFSPFWKLCRFEWRIKGKRLAFLGPRASGKTTLINLLVNGQLPVEYVATARPVKVSGKTFSLKDLQLKILPLLDLPGDLGSHGDWEQEYRVADVICYLCDASKLYAGDQGYVKTVTSEMRHIGDWFDARENKPQRVFIVATHCDMIPAYDALPFSRRTEFTDKFWKMPAMQNLIHLGRGSKNIEHVAGSLLVSRESDTLIENILRLASA